MTFFWLCILAHVIADFILQTDEMAAEKYGGKLKGYCRHCGGVFLTTFILVHVYGLLQAFLFALLVAIAHLVVDFVKIRAMVKAEARRCPQAPFLGFVIDQSVHVYILLVLWKIIPGSVEVNPGIANFYASLFPGIDFFTIMAGLDIDKVIVYLIIYLFVLFGGAIVINLILKWISYNQKGEYLLSSVNRIGSYIGILERSIIITLVLYNSVTAIALILTAKSIARFRELNNKEFAEYYLVGTMLSTFIALGGGIVLNALFA